MGKSFSKLNGREKGQADVSTVKQDVGQTSAMVLSKATETEPARTVTGREIETQCFVSNT